MIRRSLRIGIRLGMLAGMAFALFKIAQARRPLPSIPSGEDPWAPTRVRAPEPAPEPDEPSLVDPTMLQSTSLKRQASQTDDRGFDPASTAPAVVSPVDPFAPSAIPTPTLVAAAATEIEADDDEIVILSTGAGTVTVTVTPEPAIPEAAPPEPAPPEPSSVDAPARATVVPTTDPPTTDPPAAPKPQKRAAAKKEPAKKAAPRSTARATVRTNAASTEAAAKKTPAKKAGPRKAQAAWVEPDGGVCPTTHPVKAKLRSAIFHLPGMAAYARTNPDRCYRDEGAALDDGLRKAAR